MASTLRPSEYASSRKTDTSRRGHECAGHTGLLFAFGIAGTVGALGLSVALEKLRP